MFPSGLLLLTLPPKSLLPRLKDFLNYASHKVQRTLYVKLEQGLVAKHPVDVSSIRQIIPQIYVQASQYCSNLDVHVLQSFSKQFEDHHIAGKFQVIVTDCTLNLETYLESQFNVEASKVAIHVAPVSKEVRFDDFRPTTNRKRFNFVCLGGTFDRLHNGHKVLLSEAINLCSQELVIGVTDGPMIKNKTLCELIEPVQRRMETLTEFLEVVHPSLSYSVEPIVDPFGPSIVLPHLQCIVVSQETRKGGDAVNKKRLEKGMKQLHVQEILLVEDAHRECPSEESKVSSSSLRRRLLGTFLREPTLHPSLPNLPYLIGLTGGIASGKSSIGRRLQALGAGLVDCDRLAHLSYARGSPIFQRLIEEFGTQIEGPDGAIDRKALGDAVFNDSAKRQKLNSLVWPAVAEMALARAQDLYSNGRTVVVLEAALLIEAGWHQQLHQVWLCTVPEKESVNRVVSRDGLDEEAALRRVRSQPQTSQRLPHAHILFSTLWETQETQRQVEKAWRTLREYLLAQNIGRI